MENFSLTAAARSCFNARSPRARAREVRTSEHYRPFTRIAASLVLRARPLSEQPCCGDEDECDCESIDWSDPQSWIAALLSLKYDECEWDFVAHLCTYGIKQPLRTALLGDYGVTQGDGHHRLAVAIHERLAWVPLIFCRSTFETCVTCGNEDAEITSCDERLG